MQTGGMKGQLTTLIFPAPPPTPRTFRACGGLQTATISHNREHKNPVFFHVKKGKGQMKTSKNTGFLRGWGAA